MFQPKIEFGKKNFPQNHLHSQKTKKKWLTTHFLANFL